MGEDLFPVNYISYNDAVAYCEWLTGKDGVNTYRLPTESEWELAAGHMPKDADFNCGVNPGRTPVNEYESNTRGAHGAIDFWGNVWEWTSTKRDDAGENILGVKGGSWSSARTDCRTEYRKEGRNQSTGYEDVGFRVIKVLNGQEPSKSADITIIKGASVKAYSPTKDSIMLSWEKVDNAVNYQIFEYHSETQLFEMIGLTEETQFTISNLITGNKYYYVVQPISYEAIADVVYPDKAICVTCGQKEYSENESENDNYIDNAETESEMPDDCIADNINKAEDTGADNNQKDINIFGNKYAIIGTGVVLVSVIIVVVLVLF